MMLHIYSQKHAGDNAVIACDREAAIALMNALITATVNQSDEAVQFHCSDGTWFFLQVFVADSDRFDFGLPYPKDESQQSPETTIGNETPEEPSTDDIPF